MHRAYVSLGSNINPEHYLLNGIRLLGNHFLDVVASSFYTYEAEGFEGPDFLNCAAAFSTSLEPHDLKNKLRQIEAFLGRNRDQHGMKSRVIDIDLLLYGHLEWNSDQLVLPHPEILTQAYVLRPLREIASDLTLPGTDMTIESLWKQSRWFSTDTLNPVLDANQVREILTG